MSFYWRKCTIHVHITISFVFVRACVTNFGVICLQSGERGRTPKYVEVQASAMVLREEHSTLTAPPCQHHSFCPCRLNRPQRPREHISSPVLYFDHMQIPGQGRSSFTPGSSPQQSPRFFDHVIGSYDSHTHARPCDEHHKDERVCV